jgi:outer membrane protein insertion porin family
MPPYRRFFAGGPETVRGYRESRMGPKDSFGNPYGGNIKFTNQFELLLPGNGGTARVCLFFDRQRLSGTSAYVPVDG